MNWDFPEITSFGTLFAFAEKLEEMLAELSETVSGKGGGFEERAALLMKKHRKRAAKIELFRRERLNEVVLQPLTGMSKNNYIVDGLCPDEPSGAAGFLAAAEEKSALFYEEAAEKAGSVLGGLEKTLLKMARESRELAQSL